MAPADPARANAPVEPWAVSPAYLIESAPTGILLVDGAGRIVLANRQVLDLFGYERDELLGEKVELLVPDRIGDHSPFQRTTYASHAGNSMSDARELTGRRKDGSEVPIEVSFSPLRTERGPYMLAALQDVENRQREEQARASLALELETENERNRIGMDLHDGIMQEVYAIGLALELALADFDDDREVARRAVEHAIDKLHEVIRDIRSYIFDLRPRQLSGDLGQALIDLAREFQQNSQIEAEVRVKSGLPDLPDDCATALYHIVHEALSNVQKHSKARAATITASSRGGRLRIEVRDNGAGFDARGGRPERHRGLRNMQTRARAVEADLKIESNKGKGTAVIVELPLAASARRPERNVA